MKFFGMVAIGGVALVVEATVGFVEVGVTIGFVLVATAFVEVAVVGLAGAGMSDFFCKAGHAMTPPLLGHVHCFKYKS